MVVKEYTKKVTEIINEKSPKSVLIVFWHGLGDLIMFLPYYEHMVEYCKNDNIHFDLALLPGLGQRDICPSALEMSEEDFNTNHEIAFVINFPMAEGKEGITKGEYCCTEELGIPPFYKSLDLLGRKNLLVAVHMQGTCLPGSTNPESEVNKEIWNDIIEYGMVPIDVHFQHVFHNPVNELHSWVSRNCRDLKPKINTLISLIQTAEAFIGVASGPLMLSLSIKPQKTIYLQKNHNLRSYINFNSVPIVDVNSYNKTDLHRALDKVVA